MAKHSDARWVLAFGDDATAISNAAGVRVVKRLPMVVLVQTNKRTAVALAHAGDYVATFRSEADGVRAFAVFEPHAVSDIGDGRSGESDSFSDGTHPE